VRYREHCKNLGLVFFLCKWNENLQLGRGFFVHHRKISVFKRVEFVSYSLSYIVQSSFLRYHCFECASTNCEENWWFKNSFCEELEQVFYNFPKYHWNVCQEISMKDWGERIFSDRQLGMSAYSRIVMIMVLEM